MMSRLLIIACALAIAALAQPNSSAPLVPQYNYLTAQDANGLLSPVVVGNWVFMVSDDMVVRVMNSTAPGMSGAAFFQDMHYYKPTSLFWLTATSVGVIAFNSVIFYTVNTTSVWKSGNYTLPGYDFTISGDYHVQNPLVWNAAPGIGDCVILGTSNVSVIPTPNSSPIVAISPAGKMLWTTTAAFSKIALHTLNYGLAYDQVNPGTVVYAAGTSNYDTTIHILKLSVTNGSLLLDIPTLSTSRDDGSSGSTGHSNTLGATFNVYNGVLAVTDYAPTFTLYDTTTGKNLTMPMSLNGNGDSCEYVYGSPLQINGSWFAMCDNNVAGFDNKTYAMTSFTGGNTGAAQNFVDGLVTPNGDLVLVNNYGGVFVLDYRRNLTLVLTTPNANGVGYSDDVEGVTMGGPHVMVAYSDCIFGVDYHAGTIIGQVQNGVAPVGYALYDDNSGNFFVTSSSSYDESPANYVLRGYSGQNFLSVNSFVATVASSPISYGFVLNPMTNVAFVFTDAPAAYSVDFNGNVAMLPAITDPELDSNQSPVIVGTYVCVLNSYSPYNLLCLDTSKTTSAWVVTPTCLASSEGTYNPLIVSGTTIYISCANQDSQPIFMSVVVGSTTATSFPSSASSVTSYNGAFYGSAMTSTMLIGYGSDSSDDDNGIYAYLTSTGVLAWSNSSVNFQSTPVVVGTNVYFLVDNDDTNVIVELDVATGTYETFINLPSGVSSDDASLMLANGNNIILISYTSIVSINTVTRMANYHITTLESATIDSANMPIITSNGALVVQGDSNITLYNVNTGGVIWTQPLVYSGASQKSPMWYVNGTLYYSDGYNVVGADPFTGAQHSSFGYTRSEDDVYGFGLTYSGSNITTIVACQGSHVFAGSVSPTYAVWGSFPAGNPPSTPMPGTPSPTGPTVAPMPPTPTGTPAPGSTPAPNVPPATPVPTGNVPTATVGPFYTMYNYARQTVGAQLPSIVVNGWAFTVTSANMLIGMNASMQTTTNSTPAYALMLGATPTGIFMTSNWTFAILSNSTIWFFGVNSTAVWSTGTFNKPGAQFDISMNGMQANWYMTPMQIGSTLYLGSYNVSGGTDSWLFALDATTGHVQNSLWLPNWRSSNFQLQIDTANYNMQTGAFNGTMIYALASTEYFSNNNNDNDYSGAFSVVPIMLSNFSAMAPVTLFTDSEAAQFSVFMGVVFGLDESGNFVAAWWNNTQITAQSIASDCEHVNFAPMYFAGVVWATCNSYEYNSAFVSYFTWGDFKQTSLLSSGQVQPFLGGITSWTRSAILLSSTNGMLYEIVNRGIYAALQSNIFTSSTSQAVYMQWTSAAETLLIVTSPAASLVSFLNWNGTIVGQIPAAAVGPAWWDWMSGNTFVASSAVSDSFGVADISYPLQGWSSASSGSQTSVAVDGSSVDYPFVYDQWTGYSYYVTDEGVYWVSPSGTSGTLYTGVIELNQPPVIVGNSICWVNYESDTLQCMPKGNVTAPTFSVSVCNTNSEEVFNSLWSWGNTTVIVACSESVTAMFQSLDVTSKSNTVVSYGTSSSDGFSGAAFSNPWLVGFSSGTALVAFKLGTATAAWTHNLATSDTSDNVFASNPVIVGSTIYVGTYSAGVGGIQYGVSTFDLTSGNAQSTMTVQLLDGTVTKYTSSLINYLAVSPSGTLAVLAPSTVGLTAATTQYAMMGLNPTTNSVLWTTGVTSQVTTGYAGLPTVSDTGVFAAFSGSNITVYNAYNGDWAWQTPVANPTSAQYSPIQVYNGSLFYSNGFAAVSANPFTGTQNAAYTSASNFAPLGGYAVTMSSTGVVSVIAAQTTNGGGGNAAVFAGTVSPSYAAQGTFPGGSNGGSGGGSSSPSMAWIAGVVAGVLVVIVAVVVVMKRKAAPKTDQDYVPMNPSTQV